MILYLIKSILCSSLLISVYYVFLERETIHRFKRWYLLAALALSLIIPLIPIEIDRAEMVNLISAKGNYAASEITVTANHLRATSNQPGKPLHITWPAILLVTYGVITMMLLIRFVKNVVSILLQVKNKTLRRYRQAFLVIHDSYAIPHSFMKYIFLNEKDSANQPVILHELTHVRQRHTLDVLCAEFLHSIMWFNPAIIFFKKAIRLNHEFLADEVVLKNYPTTDYQNILFQKAGLNSTLSLASSFNYSATKKRLIMMTTLKNKPRAAFRIILVAGMNLLAIVLFTEKIYAQETSETIAPTPQVVTEQTGTGATPQMVKEFDSLIYKYVQEKKTDDGKSFISLNANGITNAEKARMREIYKIMTAEQRSKYPAQSTWIFTPFPRPKKNPPTAQEFAAYSDASVYGVWLDGKRIANSDLSKYKPSDISHVFKSRLLKNAAHYGQYTFHLDLMTQEYFEKTYPPQFK